MSTMLRHWALLRRVPRPPRKVDARTLHASLTADGFEIGKRTVERDLIALGRIFPLTSDEARTSRGWSWMKDADPFDIPAMDPESALTFNILERFAQRLLPRSVIRRLDPHFQRARTVLGEAPPATRAWPERVRVLPRGLDLVAPTVADDVVEIVYRGLLEGRRIRCDYRPRVAGGDTVGHYEINPLGLVFRDQVAYLVATLWDYTDIRQLALHRFESAELLDQPRTEPDGFDLDGYIEEGHFHVRESRETLALRVRFAADAAYHLFETPLHPEQTLTPLDDERVELAASVQDTSQLRWWLRGFGAGVEVVEPASLRAEFVRDLEQMALTYGTPAGARKASAEG